MIIEKAPALPKRNIMVPHTPKKCMGFLPNLETKKIVNKSRNPLINLEIPPNLVEPYFLARCCTTFSPIFLNPAHFAITGI
jgi:hypothetical protein